MVRGAAAITWALGHASCGMSRMGPCNLKRRQRNTPTPSRTAEPPLWHVSHCTPKRSPHRCHTTPKRTQCTAPAAPGNPGLRQRHRAPGGARQNLLAVLIAEEHHAVKVLHWQQLQEPLGDLRPKSGTMRP